MDDWGRVGKAVERDVREEARRCLEGQAFVVPTRACEGVEEICKRREEEVDSIVRTLRTVEERLKSK
jgi:hypothetical protein